MSNRILEVEQLKTYLGDPEDPLRHGFLLR